MKLKVAFLRRNPDIYHEFEETSDQGRKMKFLFKNKASQAPFFSPRRRADGSFPAAARNPFSSPARFTNGSSHESDDRDDVAALSRDFNESARAQLDMDLQVLSPISEGDKGTDSLEEDGGQTIDSESSELLTDHQYQSFSTAEEDDAELIEGYDGRFWSTVWESQQQSTNFPPPPSVSTLSADEPGTYSTQSITADESSTKHLIDDDSSISSSSTEKRDNSSGLFPISECSQSEAPKEASANKTKANTGLNKRLATKKEYPKDIEDELQARLDVILTLKEVVMKQGEVITAQKKAMKRYENKLVESRNVIKSLHRQQLKSKGQISHLELEAELHEARAMWSKQELYTVRTELHDVRACLASGRVTYEDNRYGPKFTHNQHGEHVMKESISLSNNKSASTADPSESEEDLSTVEQQEDVCRDHKVLDDNESGGLDFDEDSIENTLLFAASTNDSDSLCYTPEK